MKSQMQGESELDRVIKEQEAAELRNKAEARLEAESKARQEAAVKTYNLKEWEAQQKDIRMTEKGQREQQQLEATLPKLAAETEEAHAHTGLYGAQTVESKAKTAEALAKRDATLQWTKDQHYKTAYENAQDGWNAGVTGILSGNPELLKSDNVDHLEGMGKIVSGNPAFRLPRKQDGSLDIDAMPPDKLALTLTKKGDPTSDVYRGIMSAEKPKTNLDAYIKGAQEAKAKAATAKANGDNDGYNRYMETAKWYTDGIFNQVAPTVGKVQGMLIKGMAEDGDADGISQALSSWHGGSAAGKQTMPSHEQQQQTQDGLNTLGQIGRLSNQFDDLMASGHQPVGKLHTPFWDVLATMERSNPNVQAFRANIKDVVAQYRKFITGKASNEKEMADLLQAVPNESDDPRAFYKKIREMNYKVTRRIRTDLGMQEALGIKTPDMGPDFAPISPQEAVYKWGAPNMEWIPGQQMGQAYDAARGKQVIADRYRRSMQRVGGTNEFRAYQTPGAPGAAGGTLSSPSIGQSIDPQALQDYYNKLDPRLKPYFEKLDPQDQVRIMQESIENSPNPGQGADQSAGGSQ